MPDCPTCGLPYTEGVKFCPACGNKVPWKVKQKMCKVCGNMMMENDTFCSICGTQVQDEATAAELLAKKKEELKNPSMDELFVPEITDEMLGLTEKPAVTDDTPTMDSVAMPGQAPAAPPKPVQPVISAPPPVQPVITPQEEALAAATVSVQATPTVGATPNVPPTPTAAARPQAQASTVITPEGERVAAPANEPAAPTYNAANNSNYEPGKSVNNIVPIILAAAIVLVILLDVFVVFRKQIFGDKKDSSKASAVIVTEIELDTDVGGIIVE